MPVNLAASFASLEAQTTAWDEAEAPANVTLNGAVYAAAADVGRITPEWDEKTMTTRQVQTATVRIRRTLLPVCPSTSVRVGLKGLEWFITAISEQSETALVWQLHLKRIITRTSL